MYLAEIPTRVAGIPCLIGVTYFYKVSGNPYADNDWDYKGYTDSDWVVLTTKGKEAPWLDKKVTDKDVERIRTLIDNYMEDQAHEAAYP